MTKGKGHHELHGFGNGVRGVWRHVRSRCGSCDQEAGTSAGCGPSHLVLARLVAQSARDEAALREGRLLPRAARYSSTDAIALRPPAASGRYRRLRKREGASTASASHFHPRAVYLFADGL
jgi:hypothetical protein